MTRVSKNYNWGSFLATEDPKDLYSFGESVLSPIDGYVVEVYDGVEDNVVRRSLFAGIPYVFGQRKRIKGGITKIAGNLVIIKSNDSDAYICIAHLKKNSICTRKGQSVNAGQKIGECGNSGNSIQPHIHIQAISDLNLLSTNGIPLYFKDYYENHDQLISIPSFPNKNRLVYSVHSKGQAIKI